MDKVPIVDMESISYAGLSAEQRLNRIGEEIFEALKAIGFVYLVNHGLSGPLCESTRQAAFDFFALPLDVKMRYHRFVHTRCNGYTPPQEEVLSRTESAGQTLLELKESWDMKVPGEDMPLAEAPVFSQLMVELMEAYERLSSRVMTGLEVAMGRPGLLTAAHRHQLTRSSYAVLRVVHYPPVPKQTPAGAVRCATHSDWGSLTLLLQDDIGGLEVLDRGGNWVPAAPVPGAVLVNVGDLLEIWSGGELPATKHRVRLPEAELQRRAGRLCLIFFGSPDDVRTVEPPSGDHGYTAVNAREYLEQKYRAALPNSHLEASAPPPPRGAAGSKQPPRSP